MALKTCSYCIIWDMHWGFIIFSVLVLFFDYFKPWSHIFFFTSWLHGLFCPRGFGLSSLATSKALMLTHSCFSFITAGMFVWTNTTTPEQTRSVMFCHILFLLCGWTAKKICLWFDFDLSTNCNSVVVCVLCVHHYLRLLQNKVLHLMPDLAPHGFL